MVYDNPYYVNDGQTTGLYFIDGFFNEVKKRLLRKIYIEGTWIGYIGIDNTRVYYIVETYDQSYTRTSVTGTKFSRNGDILIRWEHKGINISRTSHTLCFEAECCVPFTSRKIIEIRNYNILLPEEGKLPVRIDGTIIEKGSKRAQNIHEEKVSDRIVAPNECFFIAKEKYR